MHQVQAGTEQGMQPIDVDRLADAFRVFNRASEELAGAYAGLQRQVAELTAELAAANGELRRQYAEKAALTERLALLLDALPAGVILVDPVGTAQQCNPAAETILGNSPVGRPWDSFARDILSPTEAAHEWTVASAEGPRRVSVAVTDFDSTGGRIVLLQDVTLAHHLKDHAARNERLAAMGEMVASLAHQLRTPLAAALLYAANLTQPGLPQSARERCADMTVSRLKELERLIQGMLLFARGNALGREAVSAQSLVGEVASVIGPLAHTRSVVLKISSGPADTELVCNRKALVGALTNLIENALSATGSGGNVEFELRLHGERAAFHVRDDGPGVAAEVRARLFEPFFTTRSEGTGLGLAIARAVARAHGGDVELRSTPGAGAEFILEVPSHAAGNIPSRQHGPEFPRRQQ